MPIVVDNFNRAKAERMQDKLVFCMEELLYFIENAADVSAADSAAYRTRARESIAEYAEFQQDAKPMGASEADAVFHVCMLLKAFISAFLLLNNPSQEQCEYSASEIGSCFAAVALLL